MSTTIAGDPAKRLAQVARLHRRVLETHERSRGALVHRDLAIRAAVAEGVSQADIARHTGLTRTRVAQIVGGATQGGNDGND